MGEFFKGWRRKVGLVTLFMACLFMVGWVRSETIRDEISLCPRQYCHLEFASQQGKLALHEYDADPSGPGYDTNELPLSWSTCKLEVWLTCSPRLDETLVWQWQCLGFAYGAGLTHLIGITAQVRTIPYWSIVIPLTAISAFLLLSKPRKPNPNKTTGPIPAKLD